MSFLIAGSKSQNTYMWQNIPGQITNNTIINIKNGGNYYDSLWNNSYLNYTSPYSMFGYGGLGMSPNTAKYFGIAMLGTAAATSLSTEGGQNFLKATVNSLAWVGKGLWNLCTGKNWNYNNDWDKFPVKNGTVEKNGLNYNVKDGKLTSVTQTGKYNPSDVKAGYIPEGAASVETTYTPTETMDFKKKNLPDLDGGKFEKVQTFKDKDGKVLCTITTSADGKTITQKDANGKVTHTWTKNAGGTYSLQSGKVEKGGLTYTVEGGNIKSATSTKTYSASDVKVPLKDIPEGAKITTTYTPSSNIAFDEKTPPSLNNCTIEQVITDKDGNKICTLTTSADGKTITVTQGDKTTTYELNAEGKYVEKKEIKGTVPPPVEKDNKVNVQPPAQRKPVVEQPKAEEVNPLSPDEQKEWAKNHPYVAQGTEPYRDSNRTEHTPNVLIPNLYTDIIGNSKVDKRQMQVGYQTGLSGTPSSQIRKASDGSSFKVDLKGNVRYYDKNNQEISPNTFAEKNPYLYGMSLAYSQRQKSDTPIFFSSGVQLQRATQQAQMNRILGGG